MTRRKIIETSRILHVTANCSTSTVYVLFQNNDTSIVGAAYHLKNEKDQIRFKRFQEICGNPLKPGKKVSIIYDGRKIIAVGNAFKDKFSLLKGDTRIFKATEILSDDKVIDFSKKTASLGAGKKAVAI